MSNMLIIPDIKALPKYIQLAEEYHMGFEYNDFYMPSLLDNKNELEQVIDTYLKSNLPEYTTVHGAFFDVNIFSEDAKIREVSNMRVEQSIAVARKIGAKAVVFHTNYNPFLNSKQYVDSFVKTNVSYWSGILEKYPDINIYLENMFDVSPDILAAISRELCAYSNYGVCLDYAHATLSDVDPYVWASQLGEYVKHIHINDNDGVSDLHMAFGDGIIDRQRFYEGYNKYMKDATILIETKNIENIIKSLDTFKKEGFI